MLAVHQPLDRMNTTSAMSNTKGEGDIGPSDGKTPSWNPDRPEPLEGDITASSQDPLSNTPPNPGAVGLLHAATSVGADGSANHPPTFMARIGVSDRSSSVLSKTAGIRADDPATMETCSHAEAKDPDSESLKEIKSESDGVDTDEKSDQKGSITKKDQEYRVFKTSGGRIYRDYSRASPRRDPVASIFAAASSRDPTFPVKLHMILSNGEFEDIIAWLPHGRSFRVLQPKAFEERVIPLFFRHGRYASFARQVNGWGFNRVTNGPDYGSYYHELFLRGLPHLCERMRRPAPGGMRKNRKESSSEPAPNFYEISKDCPLPDPAPTGKKDNTKFSSKTSSSSAVQPVPSASTSPSKDNSERIGKTSRVSMMDQEAMREFDPQRALSHMERMEARNPHHIERIDHRIVLGGGFPGGDMGGPTGMMPGPTSMSGMMGQHGMSGMMMGQMGQSGMPMSSMSSIMAGQAGMMGPAHQQHNIPLHLQGLGGPRNQLSSGHGQLSSMHNSPEFDLVQNQGIGNLPQQQQSFGVGGGNTADALVMAQAEMLEMQARRRMRLLESLGLGASGGGGGAGGGGAGMGVAGAGESDQQTPDMYPASGTPNFGMGSSMGMLGAGGNPGAAVPGGFQQQQASSTGLSGSQQLSGAQHDRLAAAQRAAALGADLPSSQWSHLLGMPPR